ncbi:cadherin-like beta sandwich domain-containing protein [Paenibacillus arenosi]|uniref:Cadherin-like beta sandwich domain-containing protein n=1 Tax=Paenibacillus arenosi TaxID=2774142 RepID=A0ABR9B2S4_9BACL|nr:cadherin-like beta sandwich domain-containing protein [Paenibacillus arenosi]MBD8499461.1 cadherin-like beta sandwich domain-containing protein [Paenibacillus arenosi]
MRSSRVSNYHLWRRIGIVALCFITVLVGSLGAVGGVAQATTSWTAYSSGTSTMLNNVAYGNGRWIAVSNNREVVTSIDGVSWSNQATLPTNTLGVQYVRDQWLTVGYYGKIYSSADGLTWTPRTSGVSEDLSTVATDSQKYVVVGYKGTVLVSSDGHNWTNSKQGSSNLYSLTYGGGQFVAVGDAGVIYTSTDGVSWTVRNSGVSEALLGVIYGNGTYVVVGARGTLLTSTDGVAWNKRAVPSGSKSLYGVAYGNNKFVVPGDKGLILASTDGLTWTEENSGNSIDLNHLAYGSGRFVIVGVGGHLLSQAQPLSSNADLSGLTLSAGTLAPAFSSGTLSYTADVAHSVAELHVRPTAADSKASVTVNGAAVASGNAHRVPLNVGANPITVIVTAEDGTMKTYMVTVTRAVPQSSDANLSGLALSAGTLSPAFASGTTSYTANVASSVTELDVTLTVADSKASITVNGAAVASGSASRVSLNVGANRITVVVTAEDGTPKTYTVTVTRATPPLSSNADLSGLTLSAGTLSPTFASGTLSYTADVAHSVAELHVRPTAADSKASVTVNGAAVASGNAHRVPLNVGANPITVVVTAENGTKKTYTVTVTRATPPLSSNADLSGLTLSAGTLSPTFASGTLSYTADVANSVAELDVTPTVAESKATVTVNGMAVASGNAHRVPLNVGANPITVVVTAEDGTTKTYTVTVTRAVPQSSDANLSGLSLSAGTLNPAFASGTLSYTADVAHSVAELDVTPTAADSKASVTVNGAVVASGNAHRVPLNVGANPITVVVTAENGTPKTYTVTVTRAVPQSSDANLSGLVLSAGTLTPAFASGTTSYTANVSSGVTELDVTPTVADSKASVTVNGAAVASGSGTRIPLNVGSNPITVVVTAEDGTTKTYTVTVTRAVPLSSNADLSNLTLSAGTLSPGFASGTTSYTASVSHAVYDVDVSAIASDVATTITINGTAAANGTAVKVPLNIGANVITILVTAQDGTTKTYTVIVTRSTPPQSSNAGLSSLTLSTGTLSPTFSSGTTNYTASVTNAVYEVSISAIAADATSTITINGTAAANGTAVKVTLKVGANAITILVTAQDGSSKPYLVTITREDPASNGGSNGSGDYTPKDSKGSIQVIDANGSILQVPVTHLIDAKLQLRADIYDSNNSKRLQQGIEIATDGTFTFKPLSKGTYRVHLFVTTANGERLAGTEGELVVSDSDKSVMKVTVIDPISVVRDAETKQPIVGVKLSLFWADTELNRKNGKVPGAQVALPRIEAKKLSYNENVQYSDTEGQFGWLLFPEGDYYVIAEKEGFKTYDSRKEQSTPSIHVKHTAVKLDIRMANDTKEHAPYIFGYKDGTFRPNQGITRAELASILVRLFLQGEQSKQQSATIAFTDVGASHWANKHISTVAQSKLMIGDKNGQFHPEKMVTRAEIAIIVSKLKQLKNSGTYQLSFTDVKGHWAEAYIESASEANVLKGFPNGTYRPQQSLTRAQVVVLINKILGRTPASIHALQKWKDVQPAYWAYDDIMEASTTHRYLLKDGQEVWLKQQ